MAHFLRLILLLSMVLSSYAHAANEEIPSIIDYWSKDGMTVTKKPTPEESCQAYTAYSGVSYGSVTKVDNWKYFCNSKNGNIGNITAHEVCPGGVTPTILHTCLVPQCAAGQVRNPTTGTCQESCKSGFVSGVTGSKYFGSDGSTDCLSNCTYSIAVDMCIKLTNGQGACVGQYGNGTGVACSAATNNTALTPEANCMSQGKSFISVGGVTSCVSAGSQGSQPVTTKSNSSSSSNSSTKDANGNPTGSSSSNSTSNSTATFNGDGTVVVVTTTEKTNPDGTKETKTESKTVSQTSYCAENPTAAQCKAATDSDISGACDAVACKGDAIQCAMAKEQARRNCEWFKENATAKALGEAMTNGTDTTPNPADSSNREHVNVQSSLDNSSPISASCFTDLTITLLGQSATLPLSDWCPFFEALGYIFLALSYMAALRIVAGVIV
jgi:hypothetical protein